MNLTGRGRSLISLWHRTCWIGKEYEEKEAVMIGKQLFCWDWRFSGRSGHEALQRPIVVIRVAPPRAVVEGGVLRQSRNHVWIGGFQRWDGNRYVWAPGRWEQPPRRHAHWVAPRWVHRGGGWVLRRVIGSKHRLSFLQHLPRSVSFLSLALAPSANTAGWLRCLPFDGVVARMLYGPGLAGS